MNELLQEMFNQGAVVGTGGALIVIGAMLWAFPLTFKKVLAIRRAYAAQLRAAGEKKKAAQSEEETTALVRRGQFSGRILVGVGAAVLVVDFLWRDESGAEQCAGTNARICHSAL